MVWKIDIQGNAPAALAVPQAARTVAEEVAATAEDVYKNMEAGSDLSLLPLVLAAYPSQAANSLTLATSPGTATTIKDTATLDVTLPGSDLLVDFSADINWSMPTGLTAVTTSSTTSHTHSISALTLNSEASHTHGLSGASAAASGDSYTVPSDVHEHVFLTYQGDSVSLGYGPLRYNDKNSKGFGAYLIAGNTGDFYTKPTNTWWTKAVSASDHTHSLDGRTSSAGTSHNHTLNTSTLSSDSTHSHTVGATSAKLAIRAELVVDSTVITAGRGQFYVEGFTGKEGTIQLRSIYVLQKSSDNDTVLSGGQHTVGLRFTVLTVGFTASGGTDSVVTAQNIALIIRDAAFDDRVKIFTP